MYFASPPISNGAVRSIRLSNPQIRRLCFYPSLRATRKISRHKRALPPTPPTRVEWTRRILAACEGLVCDVLSRIHDWFDYNNEWREARWSIGWSVCHPMNNRMSSTIFRVKLRQHPRDNFRVTGKPNRERKGTEWDEKREARRNGASQIGIGIHR